MDAVSDGARAGEAPKHSFAYKRRRFFNWFVLGLTYASYYVGRYNLNVVKPYVEKHYLLGSQGKFGLIGLCGFWTYAASELVNGPLTDRLGGRKAILIGAVGAGSFNFLIGLLFLGPFGAHILLGMSLLYSLNMLFQSFGAMSVVKVNAPWFHVRERGGFGGIFGIMISLGYTLAFTISNYLMGLVKQGTVSLSFVFYAPTVALAVMFLVSLLVVRDHPSGAGFHDFPTGDASQGNTEKVGYRYILKHVASNPVILTLMVAEFCTGFVRQSLLFFAPEWLEKVHHATAGGWTLSSLGPAITIGAIFGGLVAGYSSDYLFQSRRPPVAFFFYLAQIASIIGLGMVGGKVASIVMIGVACAFIFGVHGMLSGTASMDFGGAKGAASAAGMLDGIQYVASGITSVGMGALIDRYGWGAWTWSIVPFSVAGALIMTRLWNAKPGLKSAPAPAAAVAIDPSA